MHKGLQVRLLEHHYVCKHLKYVQCLCDYASYSVTLLKPTKLVPITSCVTLLTVYLQDTQHQLCMLSPSRLCSSVLTEFKPQSGTCCSTTPEFSWLIISLQLQVTVMRPVSITHPIFKHQTYAVTNFRLQVGVQSASL